MPLRFLRPLNRAGQTSSGIKTSSNLSPLQKITQQYRERQVSTTTQTNQQIADLSRQRQRLAAATASAVTAKDTPLDNYLHKSGQFIEQRIHNLQAKINGQIDVNQKK